MIDWEIFNNANKCTFNGYSHFAIRLEQDGQVHSFRLLHGDTPGHYIGSNAPGDDCHYHGFGFGPPAELLCGWPHFPKHEFNGEFPFAEIAFEDPEFPCQVKLGAWSIFIPGESRDSSLPGICYEMIVTNPTDKAFDCTGIGVMGNPWTKNGHRNELKGDQLTLFSGLEPEDMNYGDLTFQALPGEGDKVSGQAYWFRGGWVDDRETYYNDLMQGGLFKNRTYQEEWEGQEHGMLAVHFHLEPGETRKIPFLLTWNVPNRTNNWNPSADEFAEKNGLQNRWKNYYATQWKDSAESGMYFRNNLDRFKKMTRLFHDAFFFGNLPAEVIESISATMAVLVSPTCLRLEDGTFYGWEGVGVAWGSCEGSCTHVWNYTQVLPFLFPDLERSMRESHLKFGVDARGGSHFRLMLPLGIQATEDFFRPCADGQFGEIMKFFRDWKISGDRSFLERWYPLLKKMLTFAWNPENQDRWDPGKSGVLTGRQHHTLDMELFGPNGWLTGHYLGALQAMSMMADEMADPEFAGECRKIAERGKEYLEKELFNGEYYFQKIDLEDHALIQSFQAENYWNPESSQIRYQIGDGCGIDCTLAQLYASLYGIGQVMDREHVQTALHSIYRYNFKKSMRNVFNPWRVFSLNDESGVMICTWPKGGRPAIPLPYHTETMHGFEWAFAAHLAMNGMTGEALDIVHSIRQRYDGVKRNPWNEIECGSNYARSMASYALLPAISGFRFDSTRG